MVYAVANTNHDLVTCVHVVKYLHMQEHAHISQSDDSLQQTCAHATTAWRKLARAVRPTVLQSVQRATPGGPSAMTRPSASVSARFERVYEYAQYRAHSEPLTAIFCTFIRFHLAVKVCTCHNGTPQAGAGCPASGASKCASCNLGFTLSDDCTKCIRTCHAPMTPINTIMV